MCENGSEYADTVDPRVHVELERLNNATDEINKLEVQLDDSRTSFRQLLCESTAKVDAIRLKLGMCVERARPYYEARFYANEILKQTQMAAMKFERANSAHSAAREMVYLAEQGLGGRTLDPAWQEMLNHATQRVNDAERDRGLAEGEHRIACMKHEAANASVQSLQKELKRAITKSSLSIRRSLMKMSNLLSQHELLFVPYYEMKAHFNQLLEQQKAKVQALEAQVAASKLTYADALRNLEQISDEIHQNRKKASLVTHTLANNKQRSLDSNVSILDDAEDLIEEYKCLPQQLGDIASPIFSALEEVGGYKNTNLSNNLSPVSPLSNSDKAEHPSVTQSQSSEWTEINLDNSSPEEDIPYKKLEPGIEKPRLSRQKTLPNPKLDNEFSSIKTKMKLDTSISNWISRSSAKNDEGLVNGSRRQSLDNLLGPTGEKVKEIFSQGMMMLNISSLTERRNSEPKVPMTEEKSKINIKKIPSPLERNLTYLTLEDDNSDTESVSSVEMLNEDQINSLMLDPNIVCEEVLGTPIAEIVALPQLPSSLQPKWFFYIQENMGKICHLYCCWLFWLTLSGMTSGYKETSKGIRIDLIRQKTPREQYLNAPDLKKYGISFDWLYKKGQRVNDSIALYRYLDNEFYGQVVVGHPGQKMNVAFDTAWSLTWLISSECHWLKTVGCWFHNQYNHKKSSYYKPNGTKYIADEGKFNFTGYYSYENISIAHSNVTGFSFVEMNYVPFSFLFNKADGVLGLGLRDEAGSYNPFFYTLLQQKRIKKALFSIYLNRDTRSSRGGNVMLGFYDPKHIHTTIYPNKSKIPDEIIYLNVDPGQYWQFSVDKILISVNAKDFTVLCKNGCKAIVDSSSNRIDGPADEIAKIHNAINARPFIFNKWMVDCDSINDLPKIDFFLDGKEFRLSSKDYIIKMSLWSFTLCLSAFSPLETKPVQDIWVLGGAFLSQFYSIYDIDKKVIGFVRAA